MLAVLGHSSIKFFAAGLFTVVPKSAPDSANRIHGRALPEVALSVQPTEALTPGRQPN